MTIRRQRPARPTNGCAHSAVACTRHASATSSGFWSDIVKRPNNPLTYARPDMTGGKKLLLRLVESTHGIKQASRRYQAWRAGFDLHQGDSMNRLLAACDIKLDVRGVWPPPGLRDRPLVMVANHPFGVPDGVAALALAEQLGRPVKILINADLLRIPEMARFSLPIDFSDTRDALKINAASGREAIARLKAGETIVIFPSGGIATAEWPLGRRAGDLPWKTFVAKLVQKAQADVLPLFFPGQNSWKFHAASQVSMFLRLSLVLPEALRRMGSDIEVCAGDVIPYEHMAHITSRTELTALLRRRVFALCPDEEPADHVGRVRALGRGRGGGKQQGGASSVAA